MSEWTDTPAAAPARARWVRGVAIALGVLLLLAVGRALGAYVEPFQGWVASLGWLGIGVFILGYAAAVVAFVPGSAMTLAAGAIFGVVEGTLYVFVAAVLGASAAFLVARYGARGAVERRIAGDARFAAIDRAIGAQGRKITFLLRLSPAIPFNLLNYALGLTRVRFVDTLIAAIGMLPGTLLYVYTGSLAGEVAGGVELGRAALLAVGLLATAAVTIYVTVFARRALRDATAGEVA